MPYLDCAANRGRWPGRIGTFLALGRPIVSNPVGEVEMLFKKEAIGLLAMENRESMAENIIRLKNNPLLRERLGKNARQLAELMTWRKMTDKLEDCYLETIARFQNKPKEGR
jgi:glycosyltransferase involved in cell wall biosynthesis